MLSSFEATPPRRWLVPWGIGKKTGGNHYDLGLASSEELNDLDDASFARLLASRSLQWVLDNPGEFSVLVVKKLAYGFGVWPWLEQSLVNYTLRIIFLIVVVASIPGWIVMLRTPGWHCSYCCIRYASWLLLSCSTGLGATEIRLKRVS
jgi:hypothetical protein